MQHETTPAIHVPEIVGDGPVFFRYPNANGHSMHVWVAQPPFCSTQDTVQLKEQSHESRLSLHVNKQLIRLYEIPAWSTLQLAWLIRRTAVRRVRSGEHFGTEAPERYLPDEDRQLNLQMTDQLNWRGETGRMASEIVRGCPKGVGQAFAIYDWITKHCDYEWPVRERSNEATLRLRRGDCGSLSILFCSMCRATGVPARPLFGMWATGGLCQGHVWSEVWDTSCGWIPVDTSLGQGARSGRFGGTVSNWQKYFGNAAGRYIAFSIGVDFPVEWKIPEARPSLATRLRGEQRVGSHNFYWGVVLPANRLPYLQPAYPVYPRAGLLSLLDGAPHPGYWSTDQTMLRWVQPYEFLRRNMALLFLAFGIAMTAAMALGFDRFAESLLAVLIGIALMIRAPLVALRLRLIRH